MASKNFRKLAATLAVVGSAGLFAIAPTSTASAQIEIPEGSYIKGSTDPAHHSTDVNDPDPAHHRPYTVCSASTNDCVLVPVPGFDVNGYRIGSEQSVTPVETDLDPAHHSTDVNDPDPAHHRPYLVCTSPLDCRLVPIPGFDVNGFPLDDVETEEFFS